MSQTLITEVSVDILRPVSGNEAQSSGEADLILRAGNGTEELSKTRTVVVIATLTGTTIVSSFSNGLLTVGLPRMAKDVNLAGNLLLWPASFYP